MPIHDWTKVYPEIFHGFRMPWIAHLTEALNDGRLRDDYYATPQRFDRRRPVVVKHVADHRIIAMIEIEIEFSISNTVSPNTELSRLTINISSPEHREKPIAITSIAAGRAPVLFVEHLAVGDAIPEMPLFLDPEYYINTPTAIDL